MSAHPIDNICNQVHYGKIASSGSSVALGFLNSMEINVFPCSRRNSSIIEANMEGQSHYYFPYDPEARLTTEANKIKETSSNGFTQTYIKSVNFFTEDLTSSIDKLVHYPDQKIPAGADATTEKNDVNFSTLPGFNFVIGGYTFNIPINNPKRASSLTDLATAITGALNTIINKNTGDAWESQKNSNKLYANIRLVNTPLYSLGDSGTVNVDAEGNSADATRTITANTWILRDQFQGAQVSSSNEAAPSPSSHLDALVTSATTASEVRNMEKYYFSGLSFSKVPLTGLDTTSYSEVYIPGGTQYDQRVISILLLINNSTNAASPDWVVNQRALLPNIWHGEEEDSIEAANLRTRGNLEIDGDVHITGHIKANHSNKIAQFYDVDIDHNLDVDGSARVDNNLYVGGCTILKDDAHFQSDLKVNQNIGVGANLTVSDKIQSSNIRTANIYVTGFASRQHGGQALGLLTAEVTEGSTDIDGNAITRNPITTDTTANDTTANKIGNDRVLGYKTDRNRKRLILHAKNSATPEVIEENANISITGFTPEDIQVKNLNFSLAEGATLTDKD